MCERSYLRSYGIGVDADDQHVAALEAAARAAGDPMEPAKPVVSKAPARPAPGPAPAARPAEPPAPAQASLIADLKGAIAADDLERVGAVLKRLEGPISGRSLLLGHVFVSFYAQKDAHPTTALKVAHWLAHCSPPSDDYEHQEWLKGLSGGCELAVQPGDETLRTELIHKAMTYAESKHDILHNAACALGALGKTDEVLEAVARAAALGYDGLAHLRTDSDVVQLCGQAAVDAAIARGQGG